VIAAKPDVFNHNLETVPSLYLAVRPGARYFPFAAAASARQGAGRGMFTKSGIMVGLGEKRNEVPQLMDDLRSADVEFPHHRPIPPADAQTRGRGPLRESHPNFREAYKGPSPPFAKGSLVLV